MSTRIRTFLKRPKYSFYPDWCGKGLSLFPTGEWFQNNVVLVTEFTGFVWTKLRPIRAKKEGFDCFIERIQTRVAFDCKRTLGWKTVMLENFLEINRYFALTPHCNTIGQSNNAFSILGFSRGKTKRPCFDLFIHWQIKQITKTYQSHFSRSNENRSMQKWSLPYIFVLFLFYQCELYKLNLFAWKPFITLFAILLDCKQSLFNPSSLSSAGLERAKWQRGKPQISLAFLFFTFARFARFPRSRDHPEGLLAVYYSAGHVSCTFQL